MPNHWFVYLRIFTDKCLISNGYVVWDDFFDMGYLSPLLTYSRSTNPVIIGRMRVKTSSIVYTGHIDYTHKIVRFITQCLFSEHTVNKNEDSYVLAIILFTVFYMVKYLTLIAFQHASALFWYSNIYLIVI